MKTFLSSAESVCLVIGLCLSLGARAAVAGSALSFDGVDDMVSVGLGLFPNVTHTFTIEVWAYPTAARAVTPEGTSGSSGITGQRYAIFPDHGRQAYGSDIHTGVGISIGTNGVSVFELTGDYMASPLVYSGAISGWTHFAVTYSNPLPRLYVNGNLVRTGLISNRIPHPSANLGDAGYGYGYFRGMLDEVRVWSVALDGATIQSWRDRELNASHPAYTNLIGYWRYNEGRDTNSVDSSTPGHPATLLKGTAWVTPGAPISGLNDPIAITDPATDVADTSARLQGAVNPQGNAAVAWFEWGAATNFQFATPPQAVGAGSTFLNVSDPLTGLAPAGTYSFRLVASNSMGVSRPIGRQFKTPGPPEATTLTPANLSTSDVMLQGAVTPHGHPTWAWFEWGTTTNYGNTTPLQTAGSGLESLVVTQALAGLLGGYEYHCRVVATNGSGTAVGVDHLFATGAALSFDGVDDMVSIGLGMFPNVTNTFTMELWAKPTAARAATPEGTSGYPANNGQRFAIFPDYGRQAYGSDAHVGAGISIGTNGVSVVELASNYMPSPLVYTNTISGWTHIAVTYSNGLPRLYLYGSLARTGLVSGRIVHPSANLGEVGYGYGYFKGLLDEVRLWSVALDAATLGGWMNREVDSSHPAYGKLIGHWRLNEGSGTNTVDSGTNGHNGTLRNGAAWVPPGVLPGQPVSKTLPATAITTNSATLNGTVRVFDSGGTVWFEWDSGGVTNRTPGQYFGDPQTENLLTFRLSGLPWSTYFTYRCVVSNAVGMAFASPVSFITTGPPFVITLPSTGLGVTGQGLHGSVNPLGLPTTAWFEWGTDTSYGNRTAGQDVGSAFDTISINETLTNLLGGLQYHYRLVATNELGLLFGTNQSFRTATFDVVFLPFGSFANGAVAWGDYDGDGDLDLVFTGTYDLYGNSGLWRTDGRVFNAVWVAWAYGQDADYTFPHFNSGSANWCDLNNDGALDLLLTGTSDYGNPAAQVWQKAGGRFTLLTNLLGVSRSAAAVGDYDNDGRLDIVLTGRPGLASNNSIAPTNILYHQDANGAFTDVHAGLSAVFDGAVAWGDYDNDGRLDLLIAGDTGSGVIARVYRNNNGTFTDLGAGLPGIASGSVAWGDFDGDGWLDILLAGSTNGSTNGAVCKLFRNHHDGTFADTGISLPGVFKGTATWGDYDNDGQLDILLTGSSPARLYRNDRGAFTEIAASLPPGAFGAAAWGDYDGDGRLDLAMIGTSVTAFRNFLAVTNTPSNLPAAPGSLAASMVNNAAALRWNAASDLHTPAPGLTYNVRVGTTPGGGQILSGQSDPLTGQRRLPQRGNAEHRLFATLTNLPLGNYYWSVQTINHSFVGSPWATEQTFYITSGPPTVVTLAASNVSCCSALLKGFVTPNGLPTRAWFEWGTATNRGLETLQDLGTGLQPQLVQQALADLPPRASYSFRLVATNSAGLMLGTNQSFTTEDLPLLTSTLTASNVAYTAATLLGTTPLASPPADYFIEWGTSAAYGHLANAAILDSALAFDGTNDCVTVGWGKFRAVANNFTMELWVNPATARAATVESVSGTAGLSGQRYAVFPELGFVAYPGSNGDVGAGLSVGTNGISAVECNYDYMPSVLVHDGGIFGWTHVALVYSNHVPRLFVNGALARTGLVSSRVAHPSAGLGGVAGNTRGPFAGQIQDARIWDVPLDAETIRAWMNQPVTTNHPAYSHLVGYWPLSEGRSTNAADLSPRHNDGQLANGTSWTGGRQSSARVFKAALEGLSPGTTYHFRAVAINPGDTAYGEDQAFTTFPLPRVLSVTVQTAPATPGSLLRFSGQAGAAYVMEASTNLVNWLALTNLVAGPDGQFEFLDTNVTNFPTRFYRLRVP